MGTVFNLPAQAGGAGAPKARKVQAELLDLEFPARADCLAAAREAVAQVANNLNLAPEAACDLMLAVGEACNNAVQHGSRSSDGPVRVRCRIMRLGAARSARALQVEIANCGNGFLREKGVHFPMPEAEEMIGHGRGLPLMQQLVDDIEILCENGRTVVRLTKRIA